MNPIADLQLIAVCKLGDFPGSLKPVLAVPLAPNMTVESVNAAIQDTVENRCFEEAWWWPDEYYEKLIDMVSERFSENLASQSKQIAEDADDQKTYACIRVIAHIFECDPSDYGF